MKTRWKWAIPTALLCVIALSVVVVFDRSSPQYGIPNFEAIAVASVLSPQEQAEQGKELEVRIALANPVVAANQALRLRVEIWNVGKRDLLLCREIFSFSAPCTLRLDFQPLANVEHEGLAADCVPYEWMPHVLPPKAQDFANILIKDWVSIPPNHFSGATIGLDPSMYPELRAAGHYRLSATYSSGGLLESYCYYELKPFPKEVANLPAKSWQGVAYSNSVAVYVRKKKS
ncbi:MAG: hypothetical protein WBQ83_08940 [Candidatus Acidiferrales bacterium]